MPLAPKSAISPGLDSLHRLTTVSKLSNSPIGSLILYTSRSLIRIKSLFLFTGHNDDLTFKLLLQICNRTITVQTLNLSFALPGSASGRLAETMKPPKIEVVYVAYPIQFCHSSPLTGSFSCKIVFDNENVDTFMSKTHFEKISEICDFWF